MSHKLYIFSLFSLTILSFGLWLLLLINVNPFQAPSWIIITFYSTLFFVITGIFSISGYYLKIWASNREVVFAHLTPTLRQSALMAFFVIGILFLRQVNSLNWWIVCLFLVSIIMLELFFRSKK